MFTQPGHRGAVFRLGELFRVDGEGGGEGLGYEDEVCAGLHLLQQIAEMFEVGGLVLPAEVGLDIGEMKGFHGCFVFRYQSESQSVLPLSHESLPLSQSESLSQLESSLWLPELYQQDSSKDLPDWW